MTTLRIAQIINPTYTDGPGRRISLYTQGCTLACPGCQSRHLWSAQGGNVASVQDIADQLLAANSPISILGGEPMEQPEGLCALIREIRDLNPSVHIVVYSGYTWEELRSRNCSTIHTILRLIDVLVDGRFEHAQDDPFVQYRGSRNQRVIDTFASITRDEVVTLDWDTPELIINQDGQILGAHGLIELLAADAPTSNARRCGQTNDSKLQ